MLSKLASECNAGIRHEAGLEAVVVATVCRGHDCHTGVSTEHGNLSL